MSQITTLCDMALRIGFKTGRARIRECPAVMRLSKWGHNGLTYGGINFLVVDDD